MEGVRVVANYAKGVALLVGCSGGERGRQGRGCNFHTLSEREGEKSFVFPRLVDDEGELPERCGETRSY